MRKEIFIFIHVPKTGGTTLNDMLRHCFGQSYYQLFHTLVTHDFLNEDELKALAVLQATRRCITSHTISLPLPRPDRVERIFVPMIMLREPVPRLLSDYFYTKQRVLAGKIKKKIPMNCFEEWHRLQEENSNNLFKNERSFVRNVQLSYLDRQCDFHRAIDAVASIPFVGTTERFDESVLLFQKKFIENYGVDFDVSYTRKQTTRYTNELLEEKASVKARLGTQLLEQNQSDFMLWQQANARLDRDIAQYGAAFEEDLRNMRENRKQDKSDLSLGGRFKQSIVSRAMHFGFSMTKP
jgi:hypothetical protein